MALAECNTTVDKTGRELLAHGTIAFPIACYHDDFRICDVPWHWHEEWEAVFITQGNCLVAAGSQKFRLQAGEGFFIHSGALHGCWDTETSGCRFHSLVFHPRLIGGSLDSIFHQQFVQPLLDQLYDRLVEDIEDGNTESPVFRHYLDDPIQGRFYRDSNNRAVVTAPADDIVTDFIASMTDDYFIDICRHLHLNDSLLDTLRYKEYFDF